VGDDLGGVLIGRHAGTLARLGQPWPRLLGSGHARQRRSSEDRSLEAPCAR
jgi:hypothetical protein